MTNKSDFWKVAEFHEMANQPAYDENASANTPDIRAVRFREDFKLEEIIEGIEALTRSNSVTAQRAIELLRQAKAKLNELQTHDLDVDLVEYADSLADLKYVTEGAAHFYNIDLDKVFAEVHDKNMTRFPRSHDELEATLDKAEREGVEVDYFYNGDHGYYVVFRLDSGKVYKNALFTLPNIAPLIAAPEEEEA